MKRSFIKVLGIDYGTRKIGLASGDLENKIAVPLEIIPNKGFPAVIEKILAIINEWEVSLVVIGLPMKMQAEQKENDLLPQVRFFASELSKAFSGNLQIEFVDERLSSFEADLVQKDMEKHGKKIGGKDIYEAQIILQRYFDKNA